MAGAAPAAVRASARALTASFRSSSFSCFSSARSAAWAALCSCLRKSSCTSRLCQSVKASRLLLAAASHVLYSSNSCQPLQGAASRQAPTGPSGMGERTRFEVDNPLPLPAAEPRAWPTLKRVSYHRAAAVTALDSIRQPCKAPSAKVHTSCEASSLWRLMLLHTLLGFRPRLQRALQDLLDCHAVCDDALLAQPWQSAPPARSLPACRHSRA